MIPLSVPNLTGKEWDYIKSCLDTNWVSSAGEFVTRFENEICEYTGAKYAISCVNGTAALHIALIVAGVKTGDEVIVPTLTFIAPVNAVHYVQAHPVFMDCDEYFNIDVKKTIEFLTNETVLKKGNCINKKTGRRISAIIPVHIFGNAVNMEPMLAKCKELNIKIIEDATESLGSRYISGVVRGKFTGTVGDFGTYSFNGNKIITTGGGGMLVTNNAAYAERAKYLTTQAKDDEIRYVHEQVGYNYRLTNILAAMGVAQLEQLDHFIEVKKENYFKYKKMLRGIPGLRLEDVPGYAFSNYWFYAVDIDPGQFPLDREGLMAYLAKNQIQTRPIWYLNHLQKPYQNCQAYKIENALKIYDRTLNFPCSTNLTSDEVHFIIDKLKALPR